MSRIHLVEDNELNRDMLSRRLIKKGYEVFMATDGESSVALAVSLKPDLILMDMSLPLMDVWEATRYIKYIDPRVNLSSRHDLLTQLNQILGYGEILEEEAASSGQDETFSLKSRGTKQCRSPSSAATRIG